MKLRARNKQKKKSGGEERPGRLVFKLFPDYARYILDHRLREFIAEQFHLMLRMDFPMLRYADISGLSEEEIIDMSLPSHTEFLNNVVANTLSAYLDATLQKWKSDQLPSVGRDDLVAEDITLSAYIRKKALIRFIPEYLNDVHDTLALVTEIEEYTLDAETRSFNTFIDIHNHKVRKINRQLGKRTGQLLEAQELANLGSFEWDMSGKGKSNFSPQVYRILEREDLSTPDTLILNVHPQDREKVRQAVAAALKGRREFECEFRYCIDRREKAIWSRGLVEVKDQVPVRMIGTLMDVTARQNMIRELQKNDELYRQAERLAHLGNWTYDIRTREVSWSDELYRIFNMTPQSREITVDYFTGLIHPDDRGLIQKQLRAILVDLQIDYRLRVILPGNELKYLLGKGEILKNENGKPYKIIGTCQDISREVQMTEELRAREESLARLNASLEQKNEELQRKNEELTSFNYIASHDLQEPLRKIKTFSDLAMTREKERLSDLGKGWIERISSSAGRMQKLIQDLLAFSRTQLFDDSRQNVDLNEVFAVLKSTYENEITQGKLKIECCPLPCVQAVPVQVHQLFDNLISNSVKYHRDGSPVHVKVNCEDTEVISSTQKPERDYLKISFRDNGIGFEQKYAQRIFEIFQRLHGQLSYSGTGIGLAICKKIVENHNGFIRASGMPGEGAVFDVYFPKSMVTSSAG